MASAHGPFAWALSGRMVLAVAAAALCFATPLLAQVTRNASTFAELQAAVTASAASGDTINITNDIVATSALALNKSLTITGNGRVITVPVTGLDESGVQAASPSPHRVFTVSGAGVAVTINALTLRGGLASGGGAIDVGSGARLTLVQSSIERSRSSTGGGGIASQGTVIVDQSRLLRNSAQYGGGFWNRSGGTFHLDRSLVAENRSESSAGGGGGGENAGSTSTLYVNNSTFSNNQSTEIGGGINNFSGTIYVLNSTFSGNVGYGGTTAGGAIGVNGGTVRMANNLFAYNYVRTAGTVGNPTAFALNDVSKFGACGACVIESHFNFFSVNPVNHNTVSNNITYGAAADGSDNTIFSGGLLARITDGLGNEIGTAQVFRPFLVQTPDGRSATLDVGGFATDFANFPARAGTQTGYRNTPTPAAGYFNGTAWVTWIGGDASTSLISVDQLGDSRANPIVRGSASREVNNVFILRVNRSAAGSVSGGSLYGDVYTAGTNVSLSGLPNSGQRFTRWDCVAGCTGIASSDNPYSFAMPAANLTLIPVFQAQAVGDFTVTYSGNGNTGGTPPASQTASAAVTIAGAGTLVRTGYVFNGWNSVSTGGGTAYAPGASYGSSGSPNLTLFAQWQLSSGAVAPGAPTIGAATAGDTQATVAFSAPASNGGAAITGYTVTANPGGITATGSGSPITVTGLTNGVTYTFTVTATNGAGTSVASAASNGVTPALAFVAPVARPDRAIVVPGGPIIDVDVLANDQIDAVLRSGLTLSIAMAPAQGTASVVQGSGSPVIRYEAPAAGSGSSTVRYRVCFVQATPCIESTLTLELRPKAVSALEWRTTAERGFRDEAFSDLRALPSAQFIAHGLVAPISSVVALNQSSADDAPWRGGFVATQLRTVSGGTSGRAWRVLVDASAVSSGSIDLYLGIDSNGNGRADPSELACSAVGSSTTQRCDLALNPLAGEALSYWVLSRSASSDRFARLEVFETDLTVPQGQRTLKATGPGTLPGATSFNVRFVWDAPDFLPGQSRGGWLEMRAAESDAIGWLPVRIDRDGGNPSAFALASGIDHTIALFPGMAHERLFIDVPPGTTSLRVSATSDQAIELFLSRRDTVTASAAPPTIAPAPPRSEALASDTSPRSGNDLVVPNPAAGRWYVTPVNRPLSSTATVVVRATLTGQAQQLRSGGYFNPERSGSGLFIYPAGDQWAGLWYTYLQDGTPAWYYLQAAQPGSNGVWRSPIFRSSWDGSRNRLTAVGEATVTAGTTQSFAFSYTLDGETGSEAFENFSGNCPTVGGAPLNISGHWYDPIRSGTGYTVQTFPDYEFQMAFVYDAQGVARHLVAEQAGIGGSQRSFVLEQLRGACPLCVRTGAPSRTAVGTLERQLASGVLQTMRANGTFVDGVPGVWAANDAVIPLGTLRGCAAN